MIDDYIEINKPKGAAGENVDGSTSIKRVATRRLRDVKDLAKEPRQS